MALIRTLARRDAVRTVTATHGRWMTTGAATVAQGAEGRNRKGKEMLPVYILTGMVAVAVGLGLYTAKQQLLYAPDVHVKKSKRETLPEVFDPDEVAQESDKFINKSLLRKVTHVKELDHTSITRDVRSRKPRVETLKEVGVDPKQL